MREVITRPWDDWHVHFRQGNALEWVPNATARSFARALIMPNTDPPILTGERAVQYKQDILSFLQLSPVRDFTPLMTIYLTEETTPEQIVEAKKLGVIAAKLYPRGATTGAGHGVRLQNLGSLKPVFEAMSDCGTVLCVHGEDPDESILDREREFLPRLLAIARAFPKLRIVLEHVSTRAGVEFVRTFETNVVATITAHHLRLTIDDVIGGKIRPHNFCLPVAKSADDRRALLEAATSGDPRFFFGSDSAPHPIRNKECEEGCAGVFTAPVALPLLAETFAAQGALDRLEDFVSRFGAEFYGLSLNQGEVCLIEKRWSLNENWGHARVFGSDKALLWAVERL